MRKEVRWERMFPDELEAAFTECPAVYFTYGLCEPHGPQNTVGPALKTFETMKNPEESPPEDSQWFRQCKLPNRKE